MKTKQTDEQALTAMAADIEPVDIDEQHQARLKHQVMSQIKAAGPVGGITVHASQVQWIELNQYLSIKVLVRDVKNKVQTSYWRLKPGAVIPWHSHENEEDCLVLEGDISIGEQTLFSGDFNQMEKGSAHGPITTVGGALLYLKHDIHDDLSWLLG
jgi:quercetin dioxygenase-like cupin family protein